LGAAAPRLRHLQTFAQRWARTRGRDPMNVYEPRNIRNVVLVGHSGAGKTTLMEAMLFAAGAITRMGKIEDGNTVSDHDPEEIRRGISVSLSMAPIEAGD